MLKIKKFDRCLPTFSFQNNVKYYIEILLDKDIKMAGDEHINMDNDNYIGNVF